MHISQCLIFDPGGRPSARSGVWPEASLRAALHSFIQALLLTAEWSEASPGPGSDWSKGLVFSLWICPWCWSLAFLRCCVQHVSSDTWTHLQNLACLFPSTAFSCTSHRFKNSIFIHSRCTNDLHCTPAFMHREFLVLLSCKKWSHRSFSFS